jgi:hypothetical protein
LTCRAGVGICRGWHDPTLCLPGNGRRTLEIKLYL